MKRFTMELDGLLEPPTFVSWMELGKVRHIYSVGLLDD